jgi:putative DNA primase/helicase
MLTAAETAAALGGATRNRYGWLARCCCHEDKQPSLSLKDGDDGKLLIKCFAGCDARDVLAEFRRRGWLDDRQRGHRPAKAARAIPNPDPGKIGHPDFAAAIWRESVDPRGTLAERYLNGRGIEIDDDLAGRVLRFHAHCPFGRNDTGRTIHVPALVVAFRPFRDDDESTPLAAIHRIGLTATGEKIAKKMLGAVARCAVKLDADMVEEGLGICEGVETALAIRATGWGPIWALGSAGAIAKFEPIPGVETITIFADHDDTGLAAARECARRWVDAGCEAVIHLRSAVGKDFADA